MYKIYLVGWEKAKDLTTLIQTALSCKDSKEYGAIITFTGIVREIAENNRKLIEFINEMDVEATRIYLENLCRDIIDKNRNEILSIIIQHLYGSFKPGERILDIVVVSKHRKVGFNVIQYILDSLKANAPIWKKEISDSGEKWIENREVML